MTNTPSLEAQALTIVVVGRFNPSIFHPLWFSKLDIFSETDIKNSMNNLSIVHPNMSDFTIDWCHIRVDETRFVVSTKMDAYYARLANLVHDSFSLLQHTPINAIGINPEADYNFGSEKQWHEFGDKFAPKKLWDDITIRPGMQELVIKDVPSDDNEDYSQIKLKPSEKVDFGLYLHMNQHFSLGEADHLNGTSKLLETLENEFERTLEKWKRVCKHLLNQV